MTRSNTTSLPQSPPLSLHPELADPPSRRVDWHEAARCAVEIELRDFAKILEFRSESSLCKNKYRINLLVIKLLSSQHIPRNIAHCFKTFNLFEIKGIRSSVSVNAYYKTIGYAGLLLDQENHPIRYTSLDVSISFLSFHFPRKLIKYLQQNVDFSIEKSSPGIYYINNETFGIQLIIIPELPPEENLYLHCLTDGISDSSMSELLYKDYEMHRKQKIYNKYMKQLSIASLRSKGGMHMVANEWIFNLFGTSSDEIASHAKQESEEYYLPKIDELSASNERLTSSNEQLSSQNDYLKSLLRQHNISFE